MRADGVASVANSEVGAGGSCAAAANAMSIATHDAGSFSAGDVINLCDTGGVYRAQLTVPSSGSSGNPITYQAASGDTPVISGADVLTGFTESAPGEASIESQTTTNTSQAFRNTATVVALTQGFKTSPTADITKVSLSLLKVGSPTGNIWVEIQTSSSGKPSNTPIANGTSATVDISTLTTSAAWYEFTFATPPTLADDTDYFIVLWSDCAIDVNNYPKWSLQTADSYRGGTSPWNRGYTQSGTDPYNWTVRADQDHTFNVFAVVAANTYQVSGITTEPKIVRYDGVLLTESPGSTTTCAANTWDWDTNVLYVNVGEDPDVGTLEAGKRGVGLFINAKSYITIDGLEIYGANQYAGIFVWTNAAASSDVTVQNCTLWNNYTVGVQASNAHASLKTTNVLIDSNTVRNNATTGIFVGSGVNTITISNNTVYENNYIEADYNAGIRTYGNVGIDHIGLIIENNTIYGQLLSGNAQRHQGNGIHVDMAADGAIVRYNKIYNNESIGLFVEASDDAEMYYNLVYGNGGNGIETFTDVGGSKIYNNVVYNNAAGIAILGLDGDETGTIGNEVKNNIVFSNTGAELIARYGGENDGSMGSGNIYINNVFGPEGSNFIEWGVGVYKSTYDAWESAYGGTTNSVEADPLMTNPGSNDFTLTSSSPAINAGVDVGLTTDHAGNRVPFHLGVDIGAYEYQSIWLNRMNNFLNFPSFPSR